jgi:hypothetical protein
VPELMPGDLVPFVVKDHEPGACRALIHRPDEISHALHLPAPARVGAIMSIADKSEPSLILNRV